MLSSVYYIYTLALASSVVALVPAPALQARAVSCKTPDGDGVCGSTKSSCNGFFVAGYCPGDKTIQCCVPADTPADDGDGDIGGDVPDDDLDGVDIIPDEDLDLDGEIASNSTLSSADLNDDDVVAPFLLPRAATVAAKKTKGQLIVAAAEKWLKTKYVYGGGNCKGPTGGGFDCSGLVLHAVCKVMKKSLPHKAQSQYHSSKGKHVALSKMQVGDAVFYAYGGNCKSRVHHVAIYIGTKNGKRQLIHAPKTGDVVRKAKMWTDGLCPSAVRFW